jgi:predicted permease
MRNWLWRVVERRLQRVLPSARSASMLGDLAEDYARRRRSLGALRASVWLLREARSLDHAYQQITRSPDRPIARFKVQPMLFDDLRLGVRRLIARPGAALLCAGLLALGIGLATAMFSVVDSLMFQRAPFAHPEQLVEMGFMDPEPDVMDAWRATGMFQSVGAVRAATFRTGDATSGAWSGAVVTPDLFDLLDVRPIRGRAFTADDARAGNDGIVLLSEVIWRSAFGGDASLLGQQITLNDRAVTVVGIMPAGFRFPEPSTMVWQPFDPAADTAARSVGTRIIGRLKSGVPLADAEVRTGLLGRELGRLPANYGGRPPLQRVGRPDQLDPFTRQALWLLLGGVALVFVVLCANVSSLLLAQLSARRREFGVCAAIGASRGRLIRQAIVEHAIVAAAGAALGIVLAWGLIAIVPDLFLGRTLNPIDVDPRALGAAMALGAASVFLAGLLPAWIGTRSHPVDAVRGSLQAATDSRNARRITGWLLVSEVALACSLLIGSALLARSFANLVHADRGFSLDGLLLVTVPGLEDAYRTREALALGQSAIRAQVETWPEVAVVALARDIPPTSYTSTVLVGPPPPILQRPASDASQEEMAAHFRAVQAVGTRTDEYQVDPAFFHLAGIRILRGRALRSGDSDRDAVISETLAAQIFSEGDPIGQSFTIGRTPGYRVVGVASEIRLPTLDRDLDRPELYLPLGTRSFSLRLSLRCRTECPDAATMDGRLKQVHPALGARLITSAENVYLAQLRLPRAVAEVGGLFAIVTVLVAAGGLFSVLTYAVGMRRREFGIRVALGASPGALRRLVVGDGFRLVGLGVVAGIAGGWLVARALATFQYGVSVADPLSWAAVVTTIGLTSLAASWRPARRAMRANPVTLLREE